VKPPSHHEADHRHRCTNLRSNGTLQIRAVVGIFNGQTVKTRRFVNASLTYRLVCDLCDVFQGADMYDADKRSWRAK